MKRYKIIVSPRSTNIHKELANYKWKTDKNGNSIDGVPIGIFNHAMDAIRYFVWKKHRFTNAAVAGAHKKNGNGQLNKKTVFRYESVTGRRPSSF